MMKSQWCLLPEYVDKFKKGLKEGDINPEELALMTSAERRAFFEPWVGKENVENVNALFESKLLLKNQQQGMITWAKKVAGITQPAKRDLLSKIEKLDRVLSPAEGQQFLEDLAAKKLGIGITQEEAQKVTELTQKVEDLKSKVTDEKSRIAYGNALLDLYDYTDELASVKPSFFQKAVNVANLPRTLMATLDFSAPFRQGFGMISNPKEFSKAFGSMFKYAFSKTAYRNLMADITTRDTYDLMKAGGLRITKLTDKLSQREEEFISSLADKVPLVSASERAYTGFLNKLRADTFDKVIKQAQLAGEDVSKGSQLVKDVASVVNNFTGSGDIGINDRYKGAVPLLNTVFFSPRKVASTVNIFNPAYYAKLNPTARKYAIRNLIGLLGVSATFLGLAKLSGAKVETDPRSSDFGKAVFGDTRIDMTGGNTGYLTLLARLASGKTKSTITGILNELNGGFAGSTRGDVANQYLRNKLSPIASFVADFLYGKDANGDAFSVGNELKNRLIPLVIQDTIDSAKNDPGHTILSTFMDVFGFGTQSYGSDVDWTQSTGKELQQFREKVGEQNFKDANNQFNEEYGNFLKSTINSKDYQNMSPDEQQALLNKEKDKIQSDIYKQYNFKYKKDTKKTSDAGGNNAVADLVGGINNLLSKVVTPVEAANGKQITNIQVNGNRVETTYSDGSQESKDINYDLSLSEQLGKVIYDIGKKFGLPQSDFSKTLGFVPEEQRIKELLQYNDMIHHVAKIPLPSSQPTSQPAKQPAIVQANAPVNEGISQKPSSDISSSAVDNTNIKEVKWSKNPSEATKTPFNSQLKEVFGDQWVNATRVIAHQDPDGRVNGENTGFDIHAHNYNFNDGTASNNLADAAKHGGLASTDTGVFQINDITFNDFYKRHRGEMQRLGINNYSDMENPAKNIAFAKILYNEQGWNAWHGAPADLKQ